MLFQRDDIKLSVVMKLDHAPGALLDFFQAAHALVFANAVQAIRDCEILMAGPGATGVEIVSDF